MALLKLENAKTLTDLNEIRSYLSPLNIELSHWPIEKTESVGALLFSKTLNDAQKAQLLNELDGRFLEQKEKYGYQSRDLVVLHSDVPQLEDLLKKFDRCHRHDDDEVRYIVDGRGIFGFIMPNGEQVMLTVEAEEYIRVPANTEHWFVLDPSRRIKAVRYFTSMDGWVANYTGTELRAHTR
jgi:1,2-dihydroxy-3-keto-5-methylthiopentene dioxygenase